MADIIQTSDLIVLAQVYSGDIVEQINYASTLLKILPVVDDAGRNVAWATKAGGAIAESYTEATLEVTNFGSAAQDDAILPWTFYRSAFHVSGPAMAMAASTATPAANVRLWAENMLESVSKLTSKINVDLFTGASAGVIVGLEEAIGDVANTYATIDRSNGANAYWRPYVADPGVATAITLDQIRKDLQNIKVQSGYYCDWAVVSPNLLRKIATLFDASKQYVYETVRTTNGPRGKVELEGGIGAIRFDGCLFVDDKDCPDGEIFYLNTKYVKIARLPFGSSLTDHRDMMSTDGISQIALPIRMELLAHTADADKAFMKSYLQLKVTRPNSCGVRYNVAVA